MSADLGSSICISESVFKSGDEAQIYGMKNQVSLANSFIIQSDL